MSSIIKEWLMLVQNGLAITDVPERLRKDVETELNKQANEVKENA